MPVYGLVTNKDFLPSPVIPFYNLKNGDVIQYLAKVPNANKYQIVSALPIIDEDYSVNIAS